MSVTSSPSTTLSEVKQTLGTGAVVVTNEDGAIGFYGADPIAKPTLGSNDAAGIIAALVALGLVTAA